MIIDFHTHSFPDKVAAKAIENLEGIYGVKAFTDGTVAGLLSHMAQSGVDISISLAVSTSPDQVVSINTWVAGLSELSKKIADDMVFRKNRIQYPLIGFGTIHPEFEDYRDEIQRMKELGIKGVKFQPTFQKFYPDDERMFPVYEELIKAGLIILFHCGDEIRPLEIIYSTPRRLARVLDAMESEIENYNYHVNTGETSPGPAKFIFAHLGGYRLWDESEEYLVGRNIYFDASYAVGDLGSARTPEIIRSHGTDKILFGSDLPFVRQRKTIEDVLNLDITQADKDKIFGKNAALLLDLN